MRGGEDWWNVSVEASKRKTLPVAYKPRGRQGEKRALLRRVVHERCRVLVFTEDILASGDTPVESYALDVSANGLGLVSTKWFAPGTKIIIEMHARFFERTLQASVRWCNALPLSGRIIRDPPSFEWRVGLEISFRSEEEKEQFATIFKTL